ncbi:MAG: 1-aminocyclopropane-1-carboxylate deaminase/D-cysteine desulfhydrase [Chitinophagaceae bacterium]
MNLPSFQNSKTDSIKNLYQLYGIMVDVLRLDLLHPLISGNKWFKLSEYFKDALAQQKKFILSFGGAFSNHILATAAASKVVGLKSIGIIRGEKPLILSSTLQQAESFGMKLFFVSREMYGKKIIPCVIYDQFSREEIYIISEGGYGELGRIGAAQILKHSKQTVYTHIIAAAGTGTTLAGLVSSALPGQRILGISVLKNNISLEQEIKNLLPSSLHANFSLLHDYHFGGYSKKTSELIAFMNDWYVQTSIPSDFVYTGKLFYAANDLIKKNYFPAASNILIIHSGGLPGNSSLPKGTLTF